MVSDENPVSPQSYDAETHPVTAEEEQRNEHNRKKWKKRLKRFSIALFAMAVLATAHFWLPAAVVVTVGVIGISVFIAAAVVGVGALHVALTAEQTWMRAVALVIALPCLLIASPGLAVVAVGKLSIFAAKAVTNAVLTATRIMLGVGIGMVRKLMKLFGKKAKQARQSKSVSINQSPLDLNSVNGDPQAETYGQVGKVIYPSTTTESVTQSDGLVSVTAAASPQNCNGIASSMRGLGLLATDDSHANANSCEGKACPVQ